MSESSSGPRTHDPVTVRTAAYVVSRIPDDTADHDVWSVRVEAAGHGRWAVRNMGRSLSKSGRWDHEPQPSSRDHAWLYWHRWSDSGEAIDAALEAEPHIVWNSLTPEDVRRGESHA